MRNDEWKKPAAFHLPPENERLLEIAITAG
jgi:hypothetical protein